MKLNELIKTARLKAGYNQHQLAELSGVDYKTVNRIENEKIDPRFSSVQKLLKTLYIRIEVSDLICPKCGSYEIRVYFVDENLNEITADLGLSSYQAECQECGYNDSFDSFY